MVFGYAAGVVVGERFFVATGDLLVLFTGVFILFVSAFFIGKRKLVLFLVPLALFAGSVGVIRFQMANSDQGDPKFVPLVGRIVNLEGVVVTDPQFSGGVSRFTLRAEKVNNVLLTEETRVLVSFRAARTFAYHDRVTTIGQFKKPEVFTGDNGKPFDYPAFLSKDSIYYQQSATEAVVTGQDGGEIMRVLFSFKHLLLDALAKVIPDPGNGLMAGILLGARENISPAMRDVFVRTSTIHMIALSGYNISIIADACMRFFGAFFRIGASTLFGIGAVILFALMVGPSSTVVRASIMGTLALISRRTGRKYDVGRALLLAGFVMILINPKTLVYDASFALSFLATLGIIYLAPIFEQKFTWLPRRWGIRALIAGTLAAECAVMPYLVYTMGTFSIIGLLANALVLPLVPYTMLAGAIVAGTALISVHLAFPFAKVADLFLSYIVSVTTYLSGLSFAALSIVHVPILAVVLVYAGLFWYVRRHYVHAVAE